MATIETGMEVTISLSQQEAKELRYLAVLRNTEFEEIVKTILLRGVKDTCYRIKRSAQVYQQKKALQDRQEELVERAKEAGLDISDLGF